MREILFRAKTEPNCKDVITGKIIKNPKWVYGYVDLGYMHDCKSPLISDEKENKTYKCQYETIGQFTGLTDKNGKKIFEGDFVKEQDVVHNGEIQIPGHIFSVVMRNGCWCVIPIYDTDEWDFLNSYLPFLEVIGNIHDNSELLKEA